MIYADADILSEKIIGILLIVRLQAYIGPHRLRRAQWEGTADSPGSLSSREKSWYKLEAAAKAKELSTVILLPFKMY